MKYINATLVDSKRKDPRSYLEKTLPIVRKELKRSGLSDLEISDVIDRLKTNL